MNIFSGDTIAPRNGTIDPRLNISKNELAIMRIDRNPASRFLGVGTWCQSLHNKLNQLEEISLGVFNVIGFFRSYKIDGIWVMYSD